MRSPQRAPRKQRAGADHVIDYDDNRATRTLFERRRLHALTDRSAGDQSQRVSPRITAFGRRSL
jgi:hypothetical protein